MSATLFIQEARTLLPRCAASLGGCAVAEAGFLLPWWLLRSHEALARLFQVGALTVLVAMPVSVLVMVGVEYWSSMYGERGYLTMSLPVRGRQVFAAKVLYAVLTALVMVLLSCLGLLVWTGVQALASGASVSSFLQGVSTSLQSLGSTGLTVMVLAVLVSVVSLVVQVAAVMSIGAQSRWNHLGLGAPMIGFVLLYVANQVVASLSTLLVPLSMRVAAGNGPGKVGDLVGTWMLPELLSSASAGGQASLVGLGTLVTTPVLTALMAWWAVRSIERRTSLR